MHTQGIVGVLWSVHVFTQNLHFLVLSTGTVENLAMQFSHFMPFFADIDFKYHTPLIQFLFRQRHTKTELAACPWGMNWIKTPKNIKDVNTYLNVHIYIFINSNLSFLTAATFSSIHWLTTHLHILLTANMLTCQTQVELITLIMTLV